jgi:hypothetical protein
MSERLREYSRSLLDLSGAAVEDRAQGVLDVLLPDPVGAVLGLPTEAMLGFDDAAPPGSHRVGLESDWLARTAALLGDRGARVAVGLPETTVRAATNELLERHLRLPNATWRLVGSAAGWTRYVLAMVRYTAISDDRRDGILLLGFNVGTGAPVGGALARLWSAALGSLGSPPADHDRGTDPKALGVPEPPDATALHRLLQAALPGPLDRALRPFLAGLRRRLARDTQRLHDYYQCLLDEADRRLQADLRRAGDADAGTLAAAQQARCDAIVHDFRTKIDDLAAKFAVEVEVCPVRVLDLVAPVEQIEVDILRRKASRRVRLDYCPHARRLEPLPCEDTWTDEPERLACDDRVHLLSTAGLAPCPACARPYCRACHPRACPRCRHRPAAEASQSSPLGEC